MKLAADGLSPMLPVTADVGMEELADLARIANSPANPSSSGAGPCPSPARPLPCPAFKPDPVRPLWSSHAPRARMKEAARHDAMSRVREVLIEFMSSLFLVRVVSSNQSRTIQMPPL